ncbi:glutathione S-transferase N-terminal domain-containing protein [Psychrobacter sp. I-STPA6b]|uniref:glutathione S-transferase N-terminal domain-containing protein n=1 Tax=Psychrobacter sp. I-STPA6b TaxID=2585718 RepID=UPI001D0C0203|nr:glutathione S-transferase N-terminal domain-containing protein [Psychrobacter sp. I-STPA6b]
MIDPNDIPDSQLILYADDAYDSHVVRLLLAEKNLSYYLSLLDSERPEDLASLNPYNTLPVLVHRDFSLYEITVIFEYLEERYHGHKLLPDTPKKRAEHRQLAWRIQNDWIKLGRILLTHADSLNTKQAEIARKRLSDTLVTLSPLFAQFHYFMSDNYGWCDVLLSPLLFRLEDMDIQLPSHLCRALLEYRQRVFERHSFQKSIAKISGTIHS